MGAAIRILITGSEGLVGTELATHLAAQGHEVVPFDLRRPEASFAEDICDAGAVEAALAGCDGIYHLAAISRVAWGEADPELCHAVNVDGTEMLLRAACESADRPWFVFASSREIYGDSVTTPVTEDAPMAPVNHYGRSKADAELRVEAARQAGLRTATLRLSNVYGTTNDHPDRAVPSLLARALAGEELVITGRNNFFDFVHVDDCVRGLIMAGEEIAGGRALPAIHLATGIATSLGELAELAIDVAQSPSRLRELPSRSFDVAGFCGAPERARAVLGWAARIGLREGMERLGDTLRARGRAMDEVAMPDSSSRR